MSGPPSLTAAPPAAEADLTVACPSWWGAWRGLWLLTWKSQLAWRRLPGLALSLLALPVLATITLDPGDTRPYLHWVVDFYLQLVLPLYCLFVCGAMIRDELQGDTFGFLLTRPVTRAQLYLLKFSCHLLWLEMLALIEGVLLLGVGYQHDIPDLATLGGLLLGTQALAVFAYGALSALFGLLHQRYLVLGLIYGIVVEIGIARIPTNINTLSLSHHVQTLMARSKQVQELYPWPTEGAWLSILVLALAPFVLLGIGALVFTFREFLQSEEARK